MANLTLYHQVFNTTLCGGEIHEYLVTETPLYNLRFYPDQLSPQDGFVKYTVRECYFNSAEASMEELRRSHPLQWSVYRLIDCHATQHCHHNECQYHYDDHDDHDDQCYHRVLVQGSNETFHDYYSCLEHYKLNAYQTLDSNYKTEMMVELAPGFFP